MADGQIIDEDIYRAILHGAAAGACRIAARLDVSRADHWHDQAQAQSMAVRSAIHQAAALSGRSMRARRRRSARAAK